MKTFLFSATKGLKQNTLLYQYFEDSKSFFFKENNIESLPKLYNKAIDFALQEESDCLVLCHDDVIIESNLISKLNTSFKDVDIIGVAGTTSCKIQQPVLWHLMGGGFNGGNLRGAVAHGDNNKKQMTSFGPYPNRVVLLDGVFLAISRKVFEKVRFDETNPAGFHFYDLAYCLDASLAGFKCGVSDILITHSSPGLKEYTPDFLNGQKWFLEKYSKYLGKTLTV